MHRRYPRLSAADLFHAPNIVVLPKGFHAGRPVKALGGPRYVCRECGADLGVCSCFRPVRLTP